MRQVELDEVSRVGRGKMRRARKIALSCHSNNNYNNCPWANALGECNSHRATATTTTTAGTTATLPATTIFMVITIYNTQI